MREFVVTTILVLTIPPLGRALREISLSEPIRYSQGDPIESWLHSLLCLDVSYLPRVASGAPTPSDCQLYPYRDH